MPEKSGSYTPYTCEKWILYHICLRKVDLIPHMPAKSGSYTPYACEKWILYHICLRKSGSYTTYACEKWILYHICLREVDLIPHMPHMPANHGVLLRRVPRVAFTPPSKLEKWPITSLLSMDGYTPRNSLRTRNARFRMAVCLQSEAYGTSPLTIIDVPKSAFKDIDLDTLLAASQQTVYRLEQDGGIVFRIRSHLLTS